MEGKTVSIVNKTTTLCWHMQSYHKAKYLQWATANNFPSMLPDDTKHHQEEAALSTQPSLDNHLIPRDQLLHYSESAFREVAIQWLIETDQPINVLQNPMFMQMINVASHANNNVKIPNHKQT
ncbi:hypothetical protein EDC04DRAFT_2580363 [Pisolithus marmoratus]|nr:hypothetical protein EDC04DRAFT_2580363 [Pisolithus marmoratus]